MTKHTPGPWKVGRTITGESEMIVLRGKSGSEELMYDAMIESPSMFVAGVGGITRENCSANARLIAAAPELLAALKNLADSAQMLAEMHGSEWQYVLAARAAIAKAEGGE